MISDKISNFIGKVIFYPLIFFMLYLCVVAFSAEIVAHYDLGNSIGTLVVIFTFASIFSFFVTGVINILNVAFRGREIGNKVFKNWFEWSHLLLIYISGLVSLIYTLEPILLQQKVIQVPLGNDSYLAWLMGFFIATSNYSFYKAVVISKDIDIFPYIKNIVNSIKRFFGFT